MTPHYIQNKSHDFQSVKTIDVKSVPGLLQRMRMRVDDLFGAQHWHALSSTQKRHQSGLLFSFLRRHDLFICINLAMFYIIIHTTLLKHEYQHLVRPIIELCPLHVLHKLIPTTIFTFICHSRNQKNGLRCRQLFEQPPPTELCETVSRSYCGFNPCFSNQSPCFLLSVYRVLQYSLHYTPSLIRLMSICSEYTSSLQISPPPHVITVTLCPAAHSR